MAKVLLKVKKEPPPKSVTFPSNPDLPLYIPKDTDIGIKVNDTRKVSPTSGLPLRDTERKTLNADPRLIRDIVKHAKGAGIDPLTALAISYQETGFNQEGRGAFNLNPKIFGKPVGNAEEGMRSLQEQFRIAKDLQRRGVIPESEEHFLQGNNGYGIIKRGHADLEGSHKIYGLDIPQEGINFKHNPLYGKTIVSLRELLKTNPQIMGMISESQEPQPNKVMLQVKKQ
jgi:hypothetical protein